LASLASALALLWLAAGPAWAGGPRMLAMPDVRQHTVYACGAAALQAVLGYFGIDSRQDTLMAKLGTNAEIGTRWWEIEHLARDYGLDATDYEHLSEADLERFIDKGMPVIIALQAWVDGPPGGLEDWRQRTRDGHYIITTGYDAENFYFEDPATFGIGYIPRAELDARWHDFDEYGWRLEHFGIAFDNPKGRFDYEHTLVRIQ
jgi:ABC-type bacteriocin/lantibiotic exporter with double-glycine peptidase domain